MNDEQKCVNAHIPPKSLKRYSVNESFLIDEHVTVDENHLLFFACHALITTC